jgi:hypothetical protein
MLVYHSIPTLKPISSHLCYDNHLHLLHLPQSFYTHMYILNSNLGGAQTWKPDAPVKVYLFHDNFYSYILKTIIGYFHLKATVLKFEIFVQTCQVCRKMKDNVSFVVLINSSGFYFKNELKLLENWPG